MLDRKAIKAEAKELFKKDYWKNVGAYAAACAVEGVGAESAGLFIMGPMEVGYSKFLLKMTHNEKASFKDMFEGGFKDYWRNLGGIAWETLLVFLWTLLFIVPGIIKELAYGLTKYILAECPSVSPKQAVEISNKMTMGHKGEIFLFELSFIGWALLSVLTYGVLFFFYVGPYMSLAYAGMYNELKRQALESGAVTAEELGIEE